MPENLYCLMLGIADKSSETLNSVSVDILQRFFKHNPSAGMAVVPIRRFEIRIPNDLYNLTVNYAGIKGITVNSACISIFWWFFESYAK